MVSKIVLLIIRKMSAFVRQFHLLMILIFIVFGSNKGYAQFTSYVIDTANQYVDGSVAPFNIVQPGDTLLIEPGDRDHLVIKNFQGTAAHPIIIINNGGVVTVHTTSYYGISIQNCSFFRLSGQGDPANFYGIQVTQVTNGAGLGIGAMSTDYEIDHISIMNCPIAGIFAKTDPDCTFLTTRDKFTQRNTLIHDNFISHVGNEGMYIGSSKYFGQLINCNGSDTLLYPSILEGVRIYNNIIQYSGWDGLQVSSASSDCQVYNNLILFDSQDEFDGQMSGILLGGGSKCDCYNNYISQGKGDGIESHGLGGYKIFNNIIVDAGQSFLPADSSQMKHGIFVSDVSVEADSSFYILYNDIINPKSDGIRFQSIVSKHNLIGANLIINPGNYEYYETGGSFLTGMDSYVMIPDTSSDVNISRNFFTRVFDSAGISPTDYTLMPGSPLIDSAFTNGMSINFDYYYNMRPYGFISDIGTFEFDPGCLGLAEVPQNIIQPLLTFPNPVKTRLNIRFHQENPDLAVLRIYKLGGELILDKHQITTPGKEQEIQLDVSGLSTGIYIFSLQSGQSTYSSRFIKVN